MKVQPPAYHVADDPTLEELAEAARSLASALTAATRPSLRQHDPTARRKSADAANADSLAGGRDIADVARYYLRARRRRDALFPPELFADPAWDIMLDLFVSAAGGRRVSVSDACVAANVPATTALRWISNLVNHGLVTRVQDLNDGRRAYLKLTASAEKALEQWLRSAFHHEAPKPAPESGKK